MIQMIQASAAKHQQSVIMLRRYFHTYPEVGLQEHKTQAKIMEELSALGLSPQKIAGTGVIAELKGSRPGKTVALRADIDALPIQDECGQPYQSQHPGVCHACGHDGHTAMLLGVAKTLCDLREQISGTVRFLFQPSEERFPGGAETLIKEGALEGVDSIIGAHLWQPVPAGTIGISYNRLMAAPDEFAITIHGYGGHGSMPHQTVDSILVAAQIVTSLQTIVSRSINPLEPAVVSVGFMKAGDTFNVIPDTALLQGTVRTFDQQTREACFSRMEQIVKGICDAAGATYTLDIRYGFPPVINVPEVTAIIAKAASDILSPEKVMETQPVMGGEDFSCYLRHIPGAFFFVGIGNPEKGITYPHHHPKFDMDESALVHGVEVLSLSAIRLLEK